jgi:hypothetical protein
VSVGFLRTLSRLGNLQAREVASRVRLDSPVPDLSHWVGVWREALRPYVLENWLKGYGQLGVGGRVGLTRMDGGGRSYEFHPDEVFGRGIMSSEQRARNMETGLYLQPMSAVALPVALPVTKAGWGRDRGEQPSSYGFHGSLVTSAGLLTSPQKKSAGKPSRVNRSKVTPAALAAVDALTFQFCKETTDTATKELDEALEQLRELLRKGLKRGEAVALLARKVGKIFADPGRSYRIAATESARAYNAGHLGAIKDGGYRKKVWIYSLGGCERCKKLGGRVRLLGTPFWVNPEGGPYAVVDHPPLHPHCRCTLAPA